MEAKKTQNRQSSPEQEEHCWRSHSTQFQINTNKTLTKQPATLTKTTQNWPTNTQVKQQNRTEDTDTNPAFHGLLIFNKETKNLFWRKDLLFNK